MSVAHRNLELALVGLRRSDQPGATFQLARHRARDLDLVVGAEAKPHLLILRRQRHRRATDIKAVAIDGDAAGQQRRFLPRF